MEAPVEQIAGAASLQASGELEPTPLKWEFMETEYWAYSVRGTAPNGKRVKDPRGEKQRSLTKGRAKGI